MVLDLEAGLFDRFQSFLFLDVFSVDLFAFIFAFGDKALFRK